MHSTFNENKEPDISFVLAAAKAMVPILKEGDLVIVESASPIGTTEKVEQLVISENPSLKGRVHYAYCPERVLPGNIMYELKQNDRIVGGLTDEASKKAKAFYELFVDGEIHETNAKTAEMCKLVENSSRDVQIAFANELSLICDKAGIDVWELITLANKHPRVNILWPGAGVGGHCIAVDPYFILSDFPLESQIIGKAREINNYKSFWVAEKIKSARLQFEVEHGRKPRLALMGLAFKPNVDDLRESPAKYIVQKVIQDMQDEEVYIVEPNIKSHKLFKLTETTEALQKADIIAYLVAHDEFKAHKPADDKIILNFCGV
jgi:UDP-N-acetyl-D-mannosaminuronic acid dehydrogenase